MGTVFFFLAVFCIPGFPSGALVGRWGLLALVSAALWFRCELSLSAWALLAWLAFMSWWAPVGYEALNLYIHAIFLVILYCYAKQMMDLRKVAIGAGLGIALNSAFTLSQHFLTLGWIPSLTPDGGLFFNRNIATESAAMALALVVGYRLWWLVPGILPTLAYGSRAPIVALGVAGALALWWKSRLAAIGIFVAAIAVIMVWQGLFANSGDNIFTQTAMGPLGSLKERFAVWHEAMAGFTLMGQGLGSWIINFPLYQHSTSPLELRWENAHNDAVQLVFELGIMGMVLVAAYIWRLSIAIRTPEFYCLVVFAIQAFFGFPLYEPFTGALAAICAGYLFSRSPTVRSQISRLGLRLRQWHAARGSGGLLAGGGAVSAQS